MWGHLALQAALTQAVRPAMPDKTALKIMGHAKRRGDAAPMQRVIGRVVVAHQRAGEGVKHTPRVFARTVLAEVVEHRALGRKVGRAVHPNVGLLRLAAPRCQQRHRRLVGVDHALAEDEVFERVDQRRQANAADAHPLGHAGAGNVNTRAGVNLFLAVQRQMIIVLGHHDLGQQARSRDALVDDLRGQGRSLNALAALAGVFAANVAVYEELGGHAIELLAHVLALGACAPGATRAWTKPLGLGLGLGWGLGVAGAGAPSSAPASAARGRTSWPGGVAARLALPPIVWLSCPMPGRPPLAPGNPLSVVDPSSPRSLLNWGRGSQVGGRGGR